MQQQVHPLSQHVFICVGSADNGLNEKIQTIKVELKQWETRFEQENGRKPIKDDVMKDKDIGN